MAKRYRLVDRDQQFLLPVSMTDWLPEEHLVWFVIEAVARLDTTVFHARARRGGVGRRGYDPDMLLSLLVYAMAHGTRSSRQIERWCHTDIAFRILCAQDVPDHTVIARFRQRHEQGLADLLTATLLLAAELGMLGLGVVAFDGTKIAANAAMAANRTEARLRELAQAHLGAAAATDAAEDALHGDARGDEPPPDLRDRTHRGQRIQAALDEIAARKTAAEQSTAAQQGTADQYIAALTAAGTGQPASSPSGRTPKAVDAVTAAKLRWQRERARAQARHDAWHTNAAASGRTPRGPKAMPPDEHAKVRAARAAYDTALTNAATTPGNGNGEQFKANLTDPQSRLLKTRNGFIQGYNCQTAVSDDQFIIHADATQDANDVAQFEPTLQAVTNLAKNLAEHTGRNDLHIGTMLGDAGYDSTDNLTLPGPDRLIATRQTSTITNNPPGNPPDDPSPRQDMNRRLHTPEGRKLYKRRSPLAEAPNSWLKNRRGLRQFARRGLTAARSELRFAAAITNLLRLHTNGITTHHLATT